MRIGSLFSGIGGLELGLERAGLGETIWQVEANPFCRRVLAEHWPYAERFEDVKAVGVTVLAPVDLICGGFPCQDISSAGKGAGLAGSRSGLWFEFARIIREVRPQWVVIENVASGAKRWVDTVCFCLEQCGYETLPVPLSAQDVGAPHLRRRIFIIANANGEPLREQPRRVSRANREGPVLSRLSGENGAISNANRYREPTQPVNVEVARVQGLAGSSSPWAAAPQFRGMDDGLPNRVDRLTALGNAVVPQCSEVVGWVIRELLARGAVAGATAQR